MIIYLPDRNMFDHWGVLQCPIIPTNLTPYANAGIAAEIRKHADGDAFDRMHRRRPKGGLMQFIDGRFAWDLPTKIDLNPGTKSSLSLMETGMTHLCARGVEHLKRYGVEVILLPKIGTGLGGLPWYDVWTHIGPIVLRMSKDIDVAIYAKPGECGYAR